jgi:hypothetical protein
VLEERDMKFSLHRNKRTLCTQKGQCPAIPIYVCIESLNCWTNSSYFSCPPSAAKRNG